MFGDYAISGDYALFSAAAGRGIVGGYEGSISFDSGCSYWIIIIGNGYHSTCRKPDATDSELAADMTGRLANFGTSQNFEVSLNRIDKIADFYFKGASKTGGHGKTGAKAAIGIANGSGNAGIVKVDGYWLAGLKTGAFDGNCIVNIAHRLAEADSG